MGIFKKYKVFMSDMLLNMVGFGIYIVAQQILLLPLLAKLVEDEVYSSIVLYLSILNVVCNVTGGELGNVRLVRDQDYQQKNIKGDFSRILLMISLGIVVILLPIFIFYIQYSVLRKPIADFYNWNGKSSFVWDLLLSIATTISESNLAKYLLFNRNCGKFNPFQVLGKHLYCIIHS